MNSSHLVGETLVPNNSRLSVRQSLGGFTLLEVVIAMLLLALMSIMAYQAVEVVLGANERSRSDLAEDIQLQRAWQQISSDLYHLRARQYPDGLGGVEPAYMTGVDDERMLAFSRGGGALLADNPVGLNRVNYVLDDEGRLLRRSWPVYQSERSAGVSRQVLLSEVRDVRFEQLSGQYDYVPVWPPLNEERDLDSLPVMIRVTIELEDGSSTSRILAGLENDAG